jgi:naphthoate synthase
MNLTDDGMKQVFTGEATRLAYMTEEATEGKCILGKRFKRKKWLP